jgi:hypothetical protein
MDLHAGASNQQLFVSKKVKQLITEKEIYQDNDFYVSNLGLFSIYYDFAPTPLHPIFLFALIFLSPNECRFLLPILSISTMMMIIIIFGQDLKTIVSFLCLNDTQYANRSHL